MGALRRNAIAIVVCVVVFGASFMGDHPLASWLAGHRTPYLTRCCDGMMWLGSSGPGLLLLAMAVIAACTLFRRLSTVAVVAAAVGCATVVCFVLKDLIRRPRPGTAYALVSAAGYSMPSTAEAMCAAMSIAVVTFAIHRRRDRRIASSLVVLVNVVVGISLVYLGVHWLSDVCAGFMVGATVALLIVGLLRVLKADGHLAASLRGRAADGDAPPTDSAGHHEDVRSSL